MSLKSSIANNPTSTYYVDADNPIYNKSEEIDEEVDEIPKGKPVTLENVVEKIYVKNDTKTGAYYPAKIYRSYRCYGRKWRYSPIYI